MRISDWSSDVCSSDLIRGGRHAEGRGGIAGHAGQVRESHRDGVAHVRTHEVVLGLGSSGGTIEQGRTVEAGGLRDGGDFRPQFLELGIDEAAFRRSEEHTSELQSLMRISYAVFCLKKKNNHNQT